MNWCETCVYGGTLLCKDCTEIRRAGEDDAVLPPSRYCRSVKGDDFVRIKAQLACLLDAGASIPLYVVLKYNELLARRE